MSCAHFSEPQVREYQQRLRYVSIVQRLVPLFTILHDSFPKPLGSAIVFFEGETFKNWALS